MVFDASKEKIETSNQPFEMSKIVFETSYERIDASKIVLETSKNGSDVTMKARDDGNDEVLLKFCHGGREPFPGLTGVRLVQANCGTMNGARYSGLMNLLAVSENSPVKFSFTASTVNVAPIVSGVFAKSTP